MGDALSDAKDRLQQLERASERASERAAEAGPRRRRRTCCGGKLRNLEQKGNPWGLPKAMRSEWVEDEDIAEQDGWEEAEIIEDVDEELTPFAIASRARNPRRLRAPGTAAARAR